MSKSGILYMKIFETQAPVTEQLVEELKDHYGFEFKHKETEIGLFFSRSKAGQSLMGDAVVHLKKNKFALSKAI